MCNRWLRDLRSQWLDYEEPNGTIITDHRVHTINTPLQMMHTDIINFTGGNKDKVRGAEVVVWGDAAKVDSVSPQRNAM